MSKHTPGPWSVPHFAQPEVNCQCKWVLTDHMMGAVASVYVSGEGDDWQAHGDNPHYAEAVANAHLIAAAPNLLAALRDATDRLEKAMVLSGTEPELAALAVKQFRDVVTMADPPSPSP